jgi:hypothetical protein
LAIGVAEVAVETMSTTTFANGWASVEKHGRLAQPPIDHVISATERLLRAVNPSERGTESGSSETPTSSHSPLLFHGVYRPLGVYIRLGMYQGTQMGSLSARDTIRVRACERCMLATDHAYWNYTYEMRICKRFMSIREACLRAIYSYQRSMSMSNLRLLARN